ncbi:hypothetical protein N0V88_006811 [Collariella sp. IMI 366227]|nr:hypothetical protein N0V88_006811 [Collariella sp. IMI 366227]
MATARPASSAGARSRPTSYHDPVSPEFDADDVPVEILVRHLLAAKQSLSSMALVLRANDLATHSRQMHEESVIMSAQTGFVRQAVDQQIRVLKKVRRGMGRVYDSGRREFKQLIDTLDAANGKLETTMEMLRDRPVEAVFRPPGEEQKYLIEFVDEDSVESMRNALKDSIGELQPKPPSTATSSASTPTSACSTKPSCPRPPSNPLLLRRLPTDPHLLTSLTDHSHAMAQHLTSLNNHFDMCVKAVRATEGGAALARRRAAEATDDGDPVSISGVITEQESHLSGLDHMDPQERAEIVHVVVQDSPEVDEVVAEIQVVLQQMEQEFGSLKEQADRITAEFTATIAAFNVLEEIGARLGSYVAAENEFLQRRADERDVILANLDEMGELQKFYEGYASAYETLRLEVARRGAVEQKIQNILQKARESVDNLIEADRKQREKFCQNLGEFLPTDLWVGMNDPLKRWDLMMVEGLPDTPDEEPPTPRLGRAVVVDYRGDPIEDQLAVRFGEKQFDAVFDCVGTQALYSCSPRYLKPEGKFINIVGGWSQGVVPFIRNKMRPCILGGTPRSYKLFLLNASGRMAQQVADWVEQGVIKEALVDSEFPFEQAVGAYEKLATGRAKGKIVVRVEN